MLDLKVVDPLIANFLSSAAQLEFSNNFGLPKEKNILVRLVLVVFFIVNGIDMHTEARTYILKDRRCIFPT